jgi:universal stress protein A
MNMWLAMPPGADREARVLPLAGVPELRLKKILVATDFSDCSAKAFRYAVSLGKQYKAEVIVLHVFRPVPPGVGVVEASLLDSSLHNEAARLIEEWRQQAGTQANVSAVLLDGKSAHRGIVAHARRCEADLIVIGNHGRNAIGRAFIERTAEKVVRTAPCPVLVIREHEHDCLVDEAEQASTC